MKKSIILGVFAALMFSAPASAVSVSVTKVEFAKADKNKDKFLGKREFKRFISRMAVLNSASARLVVENDAYSIGFRRADKNRDKKLSFAEIKPFK